MKEIRGDAKSVRALLGGARYAIDFYQREYKWQTKQVRELLDDLATKRSPRLPVPQETVGSNPIGRH